MPGVCFLLSRLWMETSKDRNYHKDPSWGVRPCRSPKRSDRATTGPANPPGCLSIPGRGQHLNLHYCWWLSSSGPWQCISPTSPSLLPAMQHHKCLPPWQSLSVIHRPARLCKEMLLWKHLRLPFVYLITQHTACLSPVYLLIKEKLFSFATLASKMKDRQKEGQADRQKKSKFIYWLSILMKKKG